MTRCSTCGNNYDKVLEITRDGQSYAFDCFECAIHMLAPVCGHCECRIIGHGVEVEGKLFCCAHCSRKGGADGARDRVA